MKTRSRTPSPSSYNNTRNDNEGTLDIDHNNNYTTTSRHHSHTSTPLPSMTAFLSPLKSGTGGAAPAPETIIAGDNVQPFREEEEQEMQAGISTGDDLRLAIGPLDDVAQEKSESLSPLSEASAIPLYQETYYTVVSQRDDGHLPIQWDQELQQRNEESTTDTEDYPLAAIKEPVPTSFYPKGYRRQKTASLTGILSPPTQSTASSMANLSNSSSASMTTNLLAIKSHVFVQQDHQQPRLMPMVVAPIYQLSTPMSSTNSLSSPSRSASPAHHHYHYHHQQHPLAMSSTPLTAQLVTTLEATPTDNSTSLRLKIPATSTKDELRPGQGGASVKFSIDNSRSGKGHSSNSSTCSWTSSLAPPSVDEMDPGKDPHSTSPSTAAAVPPAPPNSQRSHHYPTHHHDHSRSSVLGDLKNKTQNVLRKAGFSIAPDAGLFADRGSTKPADLKVIRLFPASASFLSRANGDRHGHITDSKDSSSASTGGGAGTAKNTGFFGRPRSRSVRETSRPSLELSSVLSHPQQQKTSQTTATAVLTTSPTLIDYSPSSPPRPASTFSSSSMSVFKFERWPQWGGGHQRSSSGPARPSDWSIRPKRRMTVGLEHAHIVPKGSDRILDQHTSSSSVGGDHQHVRTASGPLPPLPPLPSNLAPVTIADERVTAEERKKKKSHQRRVSDATTLTMASTRSAGASPQRFQLQGLQQQLNQPPPPPGTGMTLQQQTIPEKQPTPPSKSMMGNWFGMVSKRRSFPSVEEEDPKRRFVYGGQPYHGFEVSGVGSQRNSLIILDDGDEDLDDLDEDSDLEEDEHATGVTGEEGGRATPVGRVRKERRRQVLVNDYGFICEPDENGGCDGQQGNHNHPPGELPNGSMVSELAARLSEPGSFLAEHERKRNLKKQHEFNRVSEAKWIHAMNQLQPDQVKKLTKFKKLARGGVPSSVRGRVWQFLANVDQYREPGLFQDLLSRGHLPIHDVIARDVHRCYPDHVHFRDGMGGTGQEDLHSILKAYAHYKPSVGYCQGMGRLVGMMLMQMPVEEAFWLLVATLEDGYLNDYFTPTLRQLRIDALVFERLLKAQDPRLAQHLETNDVSPIMYITPWFLTLFTLSLPWASVLRVWDVFYFDGVKTLFRIGLGILQICRSTLLESCPSSAECMDFLLHVPLERLGPEVLLDRTAFRIRLRRDSLEKMSAVTAGEMDLKEAGTRKSAVTSAASGAGTRTGSFSEKQQLQQQEEAEDKKKNKRSMIASLRGVKTATTSSIITTTTTTTAASSPPTSATSVRTTKTHATTSSRTDNVVIVVEPATTSTTTTTSPTTTSPTSTTTTAITTESTAASSDMNQEASSPVEPDHDNITNTINNSNIDSIHNEDDTHNGYISNTNKNGHNNGNDVTLEENQAELEKRVTTGTGPERKHTPPPPPLLIPVNTNSMTSGGSTMYSSSRPNSRSSLRSTPTPSPSSPSPSHHLLPPLPPPQSPSSASTIVLLPPIPPTTLSSSVSNSNISNSGFSPLGVFRTRKRAGTFV